IAFNGEAIVTALLGAGYRVIFRPHPRTGVMRQDFEKALEAATEIIESDPRGFLDESPDVSWQFDEADMAVVEMTGDAFDWLASGKRLDMVRQHDPVAEVREGGLLDRCRALQPSGHVDIVNLIDEALSPRNAVESIADFYLGDTTTGAQPARFIHASEQVIERRAEEHRLKCGG